MKWFIGRDCIEYQDKCYVNTNIFSNFVASMLDIGIPRPLILKLVKEIFQKKYLNELGEVVAHSAYGVGLPTTSDLQNYTEEEVVVPWLSFLNGLHLQKHDEH